MRPGTCSFLQANLRLEPVALATRLAPGTTGVSSPAPVAAGFVGNRNALRQYPGLAFDGAAFCVLSRVLAASVPYRNNPVTGGVLLTGAAGEMPADWTCGLSRQSRLRSRWRRYPGSWAMAR